MISRRRPWLLRASVPSLALVAGALTLAGCGIGGWFGDADKPKLKGDRISVLQMERNLAPDTATRQVPVSLPPAMPNDSWPQAGGNPDHAMGHPALGGALSLAWSADIGEGSSSKLRLVSRPVIAQGRIFTQDAVGRVSAFEETTGRRVWQTDLKPENERGDAMGGGVAWADGVLLSATGYAELLGLNPADGAVLWRKRISGPARGAPAAAKGRVIAQTLDNQTFAFSIRDGAPQWSHTGILETAGLVGSVSPASDGRLVILPYSSGELFALRIENGRSAWQDNLGAMRRAGSLSGLSDIRGMPVMDRGLVLAVSHSGRTVAIDSRSGGRLWEQEVGGVDTPWPAGEWVFLLSNENQVICLQRSSGRIRWITPLERYEDPKDRTSTIVYAGPTLAGDRLWLVNSQGEMVVLTPATGEILSRVKLPGPGLMPPVVANGVLYVLTDNGVLAAYR